MARVIISAGHTNQEPGAVVGELREADLTRKISAKVTAKLRDQGIITLSTPQDLDLTSRIKWINKTGYSEETDDICLEIHINDGGNTGIEGWYKDKGENNSQKLTETILAEASKKAEIKNQGAKSEYDHPLQTLAFLHDTNPTGCLLECLYIDNEKDQKFLKDENKLDLLAEGIVSGILKFFKIDPRKQPKAVSPQASPYPMATPGIPTSPSFSSPMPNRAQSPFQTYTPPSTFSPGMGTYNKPAAATPQNREDRKKMVLDKYQQVLGRKVNEQDLNYFLNLGLSEDQMVKRLIDSQEHADLVNNSQEYKKIKPEYDQLKVENQELKTKVKDSEELLKKQEQLIDQKTQKIKQLEHPTPLTPAANSFATTKESTAIGYQELQPQKAGFWDKILNKLNDIFD